MAFGDNLFSDVFTDYRDPWGYGRFNPPRRPKQQHNYHHQPRKSPKSSPRYAEEPIMIPVSDDRPKQSLPKQSPSPPKRAAPPAEPLKPKKVYHFGSKDEAARKIQCVYRGFRVRKWKPIKQLRTVKSVEEKFEAIRQSAAMEKILGDKKERMILNERVMLLVLALDEICTMQPFVKEVRKALIVKLQEFMRPLDEKEEEESEAEKAVAKEAEEKEASEKEEEQEAAKMADEDEDHHVDGFLIVNHRDAEAASTSNQEQGPMAGPSPMNIDERVSSKVAEVPEAAEASSAEAAEDPDTSASPKLPESALIDAGAAAKDEAMKRLMQDNEELKSMVSRCLDELQRQSRTISKLKTRVHSMEKLLQVRKGKKLKLSSRC